MDRYKNLTLMIVGAGIFQTYAIKIAKSLSLRVCVIDMDETAPGIKLADDFIKASTKDVESAVKAAKIFHSKYTLNGVFTCGTDVSYTVACIANELKLPGIPPSVAKAATNKGIMRKQLKKAGVYVPKFMTVNSLNEAKTCAISLGFPLVIKPVDNMGARGTRKLTSLKDLEKAFNEALKHSVSKEIILEEFIDGKEVSIDTVIDKEGKVHLITVADRYIACSPYFVEKGHTIPSILPQKTINEAFEMAKKGIRALKIPFGASKFDMKISKQGPVIGEMTARLSGGFHSQLTEPLATGMNSIKACIDIALNLPIDLNDITPKFNKAAAERSIYPIPGKILKIKGLENAKKMKNIKEIILNVKEGDILNPIISNIGKAGHVIGFGENRKDAIKNTLKAVHAIKITTEKIGGTFE